jgi:hypothetical protein
MLELAFFREWALGAIIAFTSAPGMCTFHVDRQKSFLTPRTKEVARGGKEYWQKTVALGPIADNA